MKDRRRSQAVENIREYSERLCRSRLARLHDYSYRQTSLKYSRRTITERRQEKMSNEI